VETDQQVGTVRLCMKDLRSLICDFRPSGEDEWRTDLEMHRDTEGVQNVPHARINHLVVLEQHQGSGVASFLFDAFLDRMGERRVSDLRLNVVEFNSRAIGWYLQLGFSIVQLELANLTTMKHGKCPVVFLTMQRINGVPGTPFGRMFGPEMCDKRITLVPACAPTAFLTHLVGYAKMNHPTYVCQFDPATGLHRLKDGRNVDLTIEAAHGRLLTHQPFHTILKS